MNTFVRSAIGIGASVLLVGGGIFLGVKGAHPAATTTEDAVVLAPVAINGVPVNSATAPDGTVVSDGTGMARIVTAGAADPNALPADAAAAAAALDAAGGSDPGTTYTIVTGGSGGSGTGTDDPCATSDPPADCPTGLMSAIYADTAPPDLQVFPVVNVSTSPVGTSIYCPDLTPGSGELGLGVATTVPAAVTVRYWPAAHPTEVTTLAPDGVQSQVDDWNAQFAATGSYPAHSVLFQHCGVLTGLSPNTNYVLSAVANDDFGRVSDAVERAFNTGGEPTSAPMQVAPLGNSLLYVSVPYNATGYAPLVQAWTVAAGGAADCSTLTAPTSALQTIQPQHDVAVSAAFLEAHNYLPQYSRAVVNIYDVPEGSTVVICARTYGRSDPSWTRDVPASQQFVVADSPDQVVPVLTLTNVAVSRDLEANALTIDANTQTGLNCGEVWLPAARASGGSSLDFNATLCDPTTRLHSWTAPPGAGGNVVIATALRWGSDVIHAQRVLPLSRYACVGTCPLPASLDYTIPLPIVTVSTGMCGSGFGGDCTPPTTETSLGTATIHVEWVQGNQNGRSSWSVGTPDPRPLDPPPAPPAPQFDISVYPTVTLSADGWTGRLDFPVLTDRHTTFTARISGDCFIGDAPAPITGETLSGAAGATPGNFGAYVSFGGLCPEHTYVLRVELVGDDGNRTVVTNTRDAGTTWWPGSIVFVPSREYTITGTLSVATDRNAGFAQAWKLDSGAVNFFDDTHYSGGYAAAFPDNRCFAQSATSTEVTGAITATTLQAHTVPLYTYIRVLTEGSNYGVDHNSDCNWPGPYSYVADDEIDVSWTDLLRGATITGDLHELPATPGYYPNPEIHYTLHLRLGAAVSTH